MRNDDKVFSMMMMEVTRTKDGDDTDDEGVYNDDDEYNYDDNLCD